MRFTAETFLDTFVLPLVAGGEVHVRAPLTAAEHDRLRAELDGATVPLVAIDEARTAALSTVCARPPALVFGDDELAIAVGLHNALVLSHPEADGAFVTERQRRRLAGAALGLVSQPLSRDRTQVLARHGLLHNLHRLGRADVALSWWTGKARFFGQRPPRRLMSWRSVRRVREEVTRAGFDELLAAPEVAPVTAALLRRSPLTQLIAPPSAGPPLHWEDAAFLLRDPELARTIAYAVAGAAGGAVTAAARLAAAFEQLVERNPPAADVRAVAALLVHIAALGVMGAPDERTSAMATALTAGPNRPRGLVTYAALPAALAVVAPRLAEPPGLASEPSWMRRWEVERAAVGELLGDAAVAGVAERLLRHLMPDGPTPDPGP